MREKINGRRRKRIAAAAATDRERARRREREGGGRGESRKPKLKVRRTARAKARMRRFQSVSMPDVTSRPVLEIFILFLKTSVGAIVRSLGVTGNW